MKQIFFIDSENVNDLWVSLLDTTDEEAQLLVFYTKNSPHMGYSNVRKLKESDRPITFIKCYEGTNALDFQLVSELAFRLKECEDYEMVVVTNDNGFDAAVNYWKDRGFNVRRINGQACCNFRSNQIGSGGVGISSQTAAPAMGEKPEKEAAPKKEFAPKKEEKVCGETAQATDRTEQEEQTIVPETAQVTDYPKEELDTLVRCLGKKKTAELHNALVAIYGDQGKEYYNIIKPKTYKVEPQAWKLSEKFQKYTAIVCANSELKETPEGFADFLYNARDKMKNLNSFRASLTKEYGKEKGGVYYNIMKPHVKWMEMMI